MFYINIPVETQNNAVERQVTFEDLFSTADLPSFTNDKSFKFITKAYENLTDIPMHMRAIHRTAADSFERTFRTVLSTYRTQNMAQHYDTFQIPKHSGGMRTIQAPHDVVKGIMQNMLIHLQSILWPCDSAYAYTKHRTIKDSLEVHKKADFKFFLHLDLTDFFGSSNPNFIKNQLIQLPFFLELSAQFLLDFIHFCTLNRGLPQGTPLSPFLTNMLMIPFDYAVQQEVMRHKGRYTRYADDMTISTTSANAAKHMKRIVEQTLRETPYSINESKTKVTTIYGKNWNLGLMLNKDNQITVGHRNKERFRATIFEFCSNPQQWASQESMELLGKTQYYLSIEQEYFQNILTKYGEKFNMDIRAAIIRRIKEG